MTRLEEIKFATRHLKGLDIPKVMRSFEKLLGGKRLKDEEKLSLKEFAIVHDVAKAPISDESKWKELKQLQQQFSKVINFLEQKMPHYRPDFFIPTKSITTIKYFSTLTKWLVKKNLLENKPSERFSIKPK